MFLEYRIEDGYVIKIHDTMPTTISEGCKIGKNDNFALGDEFENYIVVSSVDVEDNITSCTMVKQTPASKYLRQENERLKLENQQLIERQSASEEAILGLMDMFTI